MIGNLDNFRLGMGLNVTPFQQLEGGNSNFDGLDGLGNLLSAKNILIAIVLILVAKKFL